jgi:hypothetical protein
VATKIPKEEHVRLQDYMNLRSIYENFAEAVESGGNIEGALRAFGYDLKQLFRTNLRTALLKFSRQDIPAFSGAAAGERVDAPVEAIEDAISVLRGTGHREKSARAIVMASLHLYKGDFNQFINDIFRSLAPPTARPEPHPKTEPETEAPPSPVAEPKKPEPEVKKPEPKPSKPKIKVAKALPEPKGKPVKAIPEPKPGKMSLVQSLDWFEKEGGKKPPQIDQKRWDAMVKIIKSLSPKNREALRKKEAEKEKPKVTVAPAKPKEEPKKEKPKVVVAPAKPKEEPKKEKPKVTVAPAKPKPKKPEPEEPEPEEPKKPEESEDPFISTLTKDIESEIGDIGEDEIDFGF